MSRAVRAWVARELAQRPGLLRLGCFGSYARVDPGVGSDLDLVAVLEESPLPFHRPGTEWRLEALPVPTEIVSTPGTSGRSCNAARTASHRF